MTKKRKVHLLPAMATKEKYTAIYKSYSSNHLGFDYCGIAKAEKLDEDARRLESWLNKGFQGKHELYEKLF